MNKADYVNALIEHLLEDASNMDAFCSLRVRNALQLRLERLNNNQLLAMLGLFTNAETS